MTVPTARPAPAQRPLRDLDEDERYRRFEELQARLPHVWDAIRRDIPGESVVVVPSMSLDRLTASSGTANSAMEERSLFLLLLLRQPRLRMVYVTSMPVPEQVVSYYLSLLTGVIPSQARARLSLVTVGDASPRSLSEKLLERPRILRRVRELIPDPALCHLIAYTTTSAERDVALALGVPVYGADPRLAPLGGKTGCRRLFAEVGVPYPLGREDLHGLADVRDAVVSMRRVRPDLPAVIVKLNDGVSGTGNAAVDLHDLPLPGSGREVEAVDERVRAMRLEGAGVAPTAYVAKLERDGGIVEERISGTAFASPSVQLRVLPDRSVELLSTHDQLLGGENGQTYLGCLFPADPAYSRMISRHAMTIGRRLAELGVLGRFAVDFVVVRGTGGEWTAYAIELNLRKGGTTHPFLTLQFLTDGSYDAAAGTFRTPAGAEKHLVATDHLEAAALRALSVDDLFDIVAARRVQYDSSRRRGVVFHMLSAVTELGRLGLTAVGNSRADAWGLYEEASAVLLGEAERAVGEGPLVG